MTARGIHLDIMDTNTTVNGTWQPSRHFYLPIISENVTLNFTFGTNNKCVWYVDDVSVTNQISREMLINHNFDQVSPSAGWVFGAPAKCESKYGYTDQVHQSPTNSYFHSCAKGTSWLYQTFAVVGGDIYTVEFWYYFICSKNSEPREPAQLTVTIN
jgi:hypothetical protein